MPSNYATASRRTADLVPLRIVSIALGLYGVVFIANKTQAIQHLTNAAITPATLASLCEPRNGDSMTTVDGASSDAGRHIQVDLL